MPAFKRNTAKRSRSKDAWLRMRRGFNRLLFAAGTVVTRGAATGGSLWHAGLGAACPLVGLVSDQLGLDGGASDAKECGGPDVVDATLSKSARGEWRQIAKTRMRRVQFEPAVVIRVPSWKQDLRKMHFSPGDGEYGARDVLEELLEEATGRVKTAFSLRLAFSAVACCVASAGLKVAWASQA